MRGRAGSLYRDGVIGWRRKDWLRKTSNLLPLAAVCSGREVLSLSAPSADARAASVDGDAPSNRRLQRMRRQHPLHDASCDLALVSSHRAAEAKRWAA